MGPRWAVSRRFGVEELEHRTLLSGVAPGQSLLWAQEDGYADVIKPPDFVSPSTDNDDDPNNTYLDVKVTAWTDKLTDFAVSRTSLAVFSQDRSWSERLRPGQKESFALDLKSLDEVFAQVSDLRTTMQGHRLYATRVTIDVTETIDGNSRKFPTDEYFICRFVSAISKQGLNGQTTPGWRPDTIPFEITAYDPANPAFNLKRLDVIGSYTPVMEVSPSPAFEDTGGSGGQHFIAYSPQEAVSLGSLESGKIDLSWRDKIFGRIPLEGKAVAPRTWWADEQALARQLESTFRGGDVNNCSQIAREILDGVARDYTSFWGKYAKRVSDPAEAQVHILFHTTGKDPHTGFDNPWDFARELLALQHQYTALNPPTYSYHLGHLLENVLLLNQTPTIEVDLPHHFRGDDFFASTSDYTRARREVTKVLAHELAHAHCFTGHIIPPTGADFFSGRNFDLMQQGTEHFGYVTDVQESRPYLLLVTGRDWNAINVKKALDTMIATGDFSSPFFGRRHYPFEQLSPEARYPWMWIDDLTVAEDGQQAVFIVRSSSPLTSDVTLQWNVVDGTARHGREYGGPRQGHITVIKDSNSQAIVVPILDDSLREVDKKFQVEMCLFSARLPGAEWR